MTDMSMLQGLTSAISSYEQDGSNMIFDFSSNAVSSYLGQFVPTAFGQVAKTIDDKERDTSSTEKGLAKKVEQFTKQQIAKIPIASQILPVRKDIWGNDKIRDSNVLVRAYDVAIAPYNKKKVIEDYTDKELVKVFDNTGEKVLPVYPNKDLIINTKKYRMTSEEYNEAKGIFGRTSKDMLDSLVKTSDYEALSDEQKAIAIDSVYSYAKEQLKVNYAESKGEDIEKSSFFNVMEELKNGKSQGEYLSYVAKIKGVEKDKEKKQILLDSNYSTVTKEVIYGNTLGKEDELYNEVLTKSSININEYLNYKLQNIESDKEDDGTEKGKTISGSKKKKVYDYINTNITGYNNRLLLLANEYKLSDNERKDLTDYINGLNITNSEKNAIFKKFDKNYVIKNGKVYYK